ncbi:MAG TPA: glycosyl hydrolase [Candidatus Sulfotelmatobacter sp.]|nr:glycosyl hydrolase [Candidatus Sulfotelmatobacter sp.]
MTSETSGVISGAYSGCAVGAFVNGLGNISSFETTAGKELAVIHWYISWPDAFPTADAATVAAHGSVPLITWEPWLTDPLGTLEAIAAGSYESYVRTFLQAAKSWGRPLFLRFAHEMNGNWYPWDGYHNKNEGEGEEVGKRFQKVWRYIYNVKASLEADNVNLVWCPNASDLPAADWNRMSAYYPGDRYVDWIGLDGYNWGDSSNNSWQSFDAVFAAAYQTLTLLTTKPLMIGEFACATGEARDKAAWISAAFSALKTNYPRVKLACWFNINKERNWPIDSCPAAAAAYKIALQDSYFLGKMPLD